MISTDLRPSLAFASGWKMASFSFILSFLERVRERRVKGKRKERFLNAATRFEELFGRLVSFFQPLPFPQTHLSSKAGLFLDSLKLLHGAVIALVFAERLFEVLLESEALPQDGLDVLFGGREGNLADELDGVG